MPDTKRLNFIDSFLHPGTIEGNQLCERPTAEADKGQEE